MKHSVRSFIRRKASDPYIVLGFIAPLLAATLIGLAIHAHSKPIRMPVTQTTDSSGGVTATAPVNPPSSDEIATANAAILAYCNNDLRQDTSCTLSPNTDKVAPGFVESAVSLKGHFATDGTSSDGLALAKGSGTAWSVVWVGQSCIPQDTATQYAVPTSLNICK